MLFDLLDRVEVNGKVGIIHRIDKVNSTVYHFEVGQSLESVNIAYYLLGDETPYNSNQLKSNIKQLIDKP